MPVVEERVAVKGGSREAFSVIADFSGFPTFMTNVQDVTVIESGRDDEATSWNITKWTTNVDGRKISWTEKDLLQPEKGRIDFRLVSGDLKSFEGFWLLTENADNTEIRFRISFEFGIPMLAPLLHPLLAKKLRANMSEMLNALKMQLEGRATGDNG